MSFKHPKHPKMKKKSHAISNDSRERSQIIKQQQDLPKTSAKDAVQEAFDFLDGMKKKEKEQEHKNTLTQFYTDVTRLRAVKDPQKDHICDAGCKWIKIENKIEHDSYLCRKTGCVHRCGDHCSTQEIDSNGTTLCRIRGVVLFQNYRETYADTDEETGRVENYDPIYAKIRSQRKKNFLKYQQHYKKIHQTIHHLLYSNERRLRDQTKFQEIFEQGLKQTSQWIEKTWKQNQCLPDTITIYTHVMSFIKPKCLHLRFNIKEDPVKIEYYTTRILHLLHLLFPELIQKQNFPNLEYYVIVYLYLQYQGWTFHQKTVLSIHPYLHLVQLPEQQTLYQYGMPVAKYTTIEKQMSERLKNIDWTKAQNTTGGDIFEQFPLEQLDIILPRPSDTSSKFTLL